MPVYMKFEGIDGDATHQGHEKWIECTSFQWGTGRSIMTPVGRAANRESSAPSISEVTITKASDVASIKLFQEAVTGGGQADNRFFVPGSYYAETAGFYTVTLEWNAYVGIQLLQRSMFVKGFPGTEG